MKPFIRTISVLLAVIGLSAGIMSGCGKEEETGTKNDTPSEKVESLKVWYTDQHLEPYLTAAAEKYKDKEDVNVSIELVSSVDYAEAISEASISEGGGPDVYIAGNSMLETLKLAGLAAGNDEYADVYSEKNFPKTALSASSYKNELIAYPISFETAFLLYNKNHVENPPATIDDILSFADGFEGADGVENILKWDVSDIFFNYFFAGEYIGLGGEDGDDRSIVEIDNQKVQECMTYYQALNQFFSIDPEAVSYDSVLQEFIEGKTVFILAKTDSISAIDDAIAAGTSGISYGAAQLPQLTQELGTRGISTTDVAVVNAYSKKQEEASAFAKYLSYDAAGTLYEKAGRLASRKGIEYKNEEMQKIVAQYADSIPAAKLIETGNYWVKMEIAFSNIWKGGDVAAEIKAVSDFVKAQLEQ